MYRWEFEKGRKSLSVAVDGPLIAGRPGPGPACGALDGVGLAFMSEADAAPHIPRRARWSRCSKIGANPLLQGSSSIIPVGGSSRLRFRL